jgi:hypothetical protein
MATQNACAYSRLRCIDEAASCFAPAPHLSQKTLTFTQQHEALCFWTPISSYLVTVRKLRMRICDRYSCGRCKLFSFRRRALSVFVIAPAFLHGLGLRAADPSISPLRKHCKRCMLCRVILSGPLDLGEMPFDRQNLTAHDGDAFIVGFGTIIGVRWGGVWNPRSFSGFVK